ncbi:MAG: rane protein [Verrucomicrobiota bacterium]
MKAQTLTVKSWFALWKEAASAWHDDKCLRLGAALAFYTIFAVSPLFVIVLAVASLWFGQDVAREHLFAEIQHLLGKQGGEAIQTVVTSASPAKGGAWAAIAIGALVLGATGVFVELQDALNTIWRVARLPGGGIRHFIKDRMLSFAMILSIGFLLLVSLVVSAALAAFGDSLSGWIPSVKMFWHFLDVILSFAVITLLFALIFKTLPDVHIPWRDAWAGAAVSSVLFNLGKLGLSFYLGRTSVVSNYGAAGSLVVIVLWVYYSSQTLFFGVEFTRVIVRRFKHAVAPTDRAVFQPLPKQPVAPRETLRAARS